jgi:hypothetical protein
MFESIESKIQIAGLNRRSQSYYRANNLTDTQYISVQMHVSFYILNRSEGCFVWAAPTLRTRSSNYIFGLNLLKIRGYREEWCKVLPLWVIFSILS